MAGRLPLQGLGFRSLGFRDLRFGFLWLLLNLQTPPGIESDPDIEASEPFPQEGSIRPGQTPRRSTRSFVIIDLASGKF